MPLKILNFKYALTLVLFLFFLSLSGLNDYPGSPYYYIFFDSLWLLLLLSACCFSQTHVIFYIQIMLFLGFWMKLMAHFILGAMFVEPTGYWPQKYITSVAWDQVLLTSSLVAGGILLANVFCFIFKKRASIKKAELIIPQWYSKHANFIWYFILFVAVTVNIINFFCCISVTGLKPKVILPFHLNALITMIMVMVIPLCMATFLGWERDLQQKKKRFNWVCFIAFITSLSILSRGVYLFWTLPYIVILISHTEFSIKQLSVWENRHLVLAYFAFAIFSLVLVSLTRAHFYPPTVSSAEKTHASKNLEQFSQVKKLFIGRWVGLEAMMATTAFPKSGWEFFKEHALKKPSHGDVGIYTRDILKLNNYHNTKDTMFSSLPGLGGILNYTHSKTLVFWGLFGICFLLCGTEKIIFLILKNRFLLSQQGFILSYWCVSGLNIPYLGIINLLECLFVAAFLVSISLSYDWAMKYFNKNSSLYST